VTTPVTLVPIEQRPSRWTVASLLVGLPLAYWVMGAVTPWAGQLFDRRDYGAFYGFWLSVVVLHWLSVAVCLVVLRRNGISLTDVGAPDLLRTMRMIALLAAIGVLFVLVRSTLGPVTVFGGTPFFANGSPTDAPQRLVWVVLAITAGVCEEFVYRGTALTLLRRRGLRTGAAVALATISFALMHGPAGIFGFPLVGTLAVVMSIVYLRTRSLAPGMFAHALLDLAAMLT
jgi:uncharacterized protein